MGHVCRQELALTRVGRVSSHSALLTGGRLLEPVAGRVEALPLMCESAIIFSILAEPLNFSLMNFTTPKMALTTVVPAVAAALKRTTNCKLPPVGDVGSGM